ncbi:MAG: hypothetical protein ACLVME_06030 [Ezakiella coagulans]|uniref:hypothetical protein n=1 Tax=Ezakiella coagulans TaxID=46507 RepID=UPI00399BC0B8
MKEKYTRDFYAEFASGIIDVTKEGARKFLKKALDNSDLEKELRDGFGMQFFKNQMLLNSLKEVLFALDYYEEFDAEFIARMRTEFLIGFLVDFLFDVGDEILSVCKEK